MRFLTHDSSELSQPKLNKVRKMAHQREKRKRLSSVGVKEGREEKKEGGRKEERKEKEKKKKKKKKKKDVYNIWYSRVVTLPSTNQTISRLTAMSGTGMGTFDCVWS